MEHTVPSPAQRIDDARMRLYEVLAPASDAEREFIRYLTRALSTPGSLVAFVTMAERVSQR